MKSIKTIVVGRNKANNIFYMVNSETTDSEPWYQGSSDEAKVRKVVTPKVFDSRLQAQFMVNKLKRETFTTDWWTESV